MPKIGSQYYCPPTCSARRHRLAYVPARGYRFANSFQIADQSSQPQNDNLSASKPRDSQYSPNSLDLDEDDGSISNNDYQFEVTENENDSLLLPTAIGELENEDFFDMFDHGSNNNNDTLSAAIPVDDNRRHPASPVISPEEARCIRWVNFKLMHNIDNVGFSLFSKIPGIDAKTWYSCKEVVNRCTMLSPVVYDCCPKVPCINFFGAYAEETECPTCHEERYRPSGSSRQSRKTFTYIPLRPRLHGLFAQAELARRMQEYPKEVMSRCSDESGLVLDFWNGDLMKRLRKDGFFKTKTEIALTLSVDGVQLVKSGTHQVWPIMGTIMNLPPDMRYNKKNLLLFGAIPGPNMPRDIFSFLGPLLEEMKHLSETGMTVWNAAEGFYTTVKVHLCLVTGGQPAVAKLMCMKGHNGKRPCRFCFIKGQSVIEGGPLYFPLAQVKDMDLTGRPCLKARESLRQDIEAACKINQKSVFKRISGRSPLLDVPTLYWPESFPTDIMHLILEGVVPRTFEIWKDVRPSQYHATEKLITDLEGLGRDIVSCAKDVPASLARSPLVGVLAVHHGEDLWECCELVERKEESR